MARNRYYKSKHWLALRAEAIRRAGGRCSVPGCTAKGTHVDHIKTRPNVDYPTSLDVLGNLRVLCKSHDNEVKEHRGGRRANGGVFRGCDVNGYPVDPSRGWR